MSAPVVIDTATLTFDSVVYKVESLPAGKGRSCDAIDVTVCDDTRKQYVPGAVSTNEDIEAVISGDTKPTVNDKASLTLTLNGTAVAIGDAILMNAKPTDITTDNGSRKVGWTCTFRPCGANPPASNG